MQFDPQALEALLHKSDTELWAVIRQICAANRIPLSSAPPSAEEMRKIRAMMGGVNAGNFGDFVKKAKEYQSKGGNHEC